ncbi:MAG TPA: GNAT family N-acetyltransferase [Acidimicrobiales bacterium]|nr:GNAT family N-acetyltransferase [Acidimicrobiales bacterium]
MTDIRLRRLEPGEEDRFVRSVMVPFLDPPTDDPAVEEELARWSQRVEVGRAWVAEAGGRFVANCETKTMLLTVPSPVGGPCPDVAMAGVTEVGVAPTHRRRGLLTAMMGEMLGDARRRGEPIAGLIASESAIYGRFGFGHATDGHTLLIETAHSAYLRPAAELNLALLDRAEAKKELPAMFDRFRRARPGQPDRSRARWEAILDDGPHYRGKDRGAFVAACADGFVRYRATDDGTELIVEDLYGATPEVEAALWRYVLDIDLVGRVRARRRPVDEPVRWRLADPRRLEVTEAQDMLWIRILDVAAALQARGYRHRGRLVIELAGGEGRWLLDAGPDGAECRPAKKGEPTDLRMRLADLGSVYLGGFRPSMLAAAGAVEELTSGSLDVADALFSAPLAPVTGTGF